MPGAYKQDRQISAMMMITAFKDPLLVGPAFFDLTVAACESALAKAVCLINPSTDSDEEDSEAERDAGVFVVQPPGYRSGHPRFSLLAPIPTPTPGKSRWPCKMNSCAGMLNRGCQRATL